MDAPPVITLLAPTLPPRSQRNLRRVLVDLGAFVHVSSNRTDALPPGTTHVLLGTPIAHPLLCLAIASARTIRLITPAFVAAAEKVASLTPAPDPSHEPRVTRTSAMSASTLLSEIPLKTLVEAVDHASRLPASPEALWLGRPWPDAHAFWRACPSAPLAGQRVIVVGQTRPRGPAGVAAPTSKILTTLLAAAAADLAAPGARAISFAIVAPGLNERNNQEVNRLVSDGVLCLSSGFVIDLIARVDANPSLHVLFEQQKDLCGPALNVRSIPQLGFPLPIVAQRQPISSQSIPLTHPKQPAQLLQSGELTVANTCRHDQTEAPASCQSVSVPPTTNVTSAPTFLPADGRREDVSPPDSRPPRSSVSNKLASSAASGSPNSPHISPTDCSPSEVRPEAADRRQSPERQPDPLRPSLPVEITGTHTATNSLTESDVLKEAIASVAVSAPLPTRDIMEISTHAGCNDNDAEVQDASNRSPISEHPAACANPLSPTLRSSTDLLTAKTSANSVVNPSLSTSNSHSRSGSPTAQGSGSPNGTIPSCSILPTTSTTAPTPKAPVPSVPPTQSPSIPFQPNAEPDEVIAVERSPVTTTPTQGIGAPSRKKSPSCNKIEERREQRQEGFSPQYAAPKRPRPILNDSPVTPLPGRRRSTRPTRQPVEHNTAQDQTPSTPSQLKPSARIPHPTLPHRSRDVIDLTGSQNQPACRRSKERRRLIPNFTNPSSSEGELDNGQRNSSHIMPTVDIPKDTGSQQPHRQRKHHPSCSPSSPVVPANTVPQNNNVKHKKKPNRKRPRGAQRRVIVSSDDESSEVGKRKSTTPSRALTIGNDSESHDLHHGTPALVTDLATPVANAPSRERPSNFGKGSNGVPSNMHKPEVSKAQSRRRRRSNTGSDSDDEQTSAVLDEERFVPDDDGPELSLVDGFKFIANCIGGEPKEKQVKKLLKKMGAPMKQKHHESDDVDKDEDEDIPIPVSSRPGALESAGDQEESPIFIDDREAVSIALENSGLTGLVDGRTDRSGEDLTRNTENTSRVGRRLTKNTTTVENPNTQLQLRFPKNIIEVTGIVSRDCIDVSRAGNIEIADGHIVDDNVCQGEVSALDWIVASEKLVGFVESSDGSNIRSSTSVACRRLWRSMIEAKVLDTFASSLKPSESQARVIVGCCFRMMTLGFQTDMTGVLLRELLSLREKQKRRGHDSLEIMLSASSPVGVDPHHKAISALWALLFKVVTENQPSENPWDYFNGALASTIDTVFEKNRYSEQRYVKTLAQRGETLVETFAVVGAASWLRLENLIPQTENIQVSKAPLPPNWNIVCQALKAISTSTSSFGNRDIAEKTLFSFLRAVVVTLCRGVWPVSEELMSSVYSATKSVSALGSGACFCEKTPRPSWSSNIHQCPTEDWEAIVAEVRNPCDLSFLIGSLFANKGDGNIMKRTMSVIRSGTQLCSDASNPGRPSVHDVNHYIGVLSSVADSMTSSSSNGEYLFCRMLTARCPSLESLPPNGEIDGASIERSLQAVLDAVCNRASIVMKSDKSEAVHVYMSWLWEKTACSVKMMRSFGNDQVSASGLQREVRRIHETIFSKSASQYLRSVFVVMNKVSEQFLQNNSFCSAAIKIVTSIPEITGVLCSVCCDIVTQLRSNREEALSKNRDALLVDLLGVIESSTKAATLVLEEVLNENGPVSNDSVRSFTEDAKRKAQEGTRAFVSMLNNGCEDMVLAAIDCAAVIRDPGHAARARVRATGIISHAFGFRVLSGCQGWNVNDCGSLVMGLRNKRLDILWWERIRGTEIGISVNCEDDENFVLLDYTTLLNFWSATISSKWMKEMVAGNTEVESIAIAAFLWLLLNNKEALDDKTRGKISAMVNSVRRAIPSLNSLPEWPCDAAASWSSSPSSPSSIGRPDGTNLRVRFSERALRHSVAHWTIDKRLSLVGQLRRSTAKALRGGDGARGSGVLDAMQVHAILFRCEAEARGMCAGTSARWMHQWLSELTSALQRAAQWRASGSSAVSGRQCEITQGEVMHALSMASCESRAMELRVAVLRFVRALDETDDLHAIWNPLVNVTSIEGEDAPEPRTEDEATRRMRRRNADDWRRYAFRSVVEDALTRGVQGGRAPRAATRRLTAAAQNPGLHTAVRTVVGKVRAQGQDHVLEADMIAWQAWQTACQLSGESASAH